MDNQKVIIESLAMDLKRVAIGLNRGSQKMAGRFFQEALARKAEVSINDIPPYISEIMGKITRDKKLDEQFAEQLLVYSILIENFVTKRLN